MDVYDSQSVTQNEVIYVGKRKHVNRPNIEHSEFGAFVLHNLIKQVVTG